MYVLLTAADIPTAIKLSWFFFLKKWRKRKKMEGTFLHFMAIYTGCTVINLKRFSRHLQPKFWCVWKLKILDQKESSIFLTRGKCCSCYLVKGDIWSDVSMAEIISWHLIRKISKNLRPEAREVVVVTKERLRNFPGLGCILTWPAFPNSFIKFMPSQT